MCFGGSGGNQGGSGSQEDAEVRRSHSKAGISAAETRRYFRERDNPAHSRNENAPGASKSVSHSRDEGGNLVSQRVEYGQGNFSDGSMKAENILGKRDDVFSVGNDLSVGGKIFSNARLSKSGNSIISTDPNNVGTIGGITSSGGLWGGQEVQSALGVGAQDSKGIATGLVTPRLAAQNLSRTEKYQETSNQFAGKTPAEIAAIRAANKAKNPLDRDGDGNILTSTDAMGRVYGIGTTGDGSGAQPVIYDPTLPEAYRGIPQLDPNRASDPNLTMFGKGMRKAGLPLAGALIPGAGALMLLNKFEDKVPSALTGRGTYSPAYDEPIGPNLPTTFATSNESAPNPFGAFGDMGGIEPEASFQQKNPMGALTATSNLRPTVINDATRDRMRNEAALLPSAETVAVNDAKPEIMLTNNLLRTPVPQALTGGSMYNAGKGGESIRDAAMGRNMIVPPTNLPSTEYKNRTSDDFSSIPYDKRSTIIRGNDYPLNDAFIFRDLYLRDDDIEAMMPPVDDEQSIYDRFNYRKWLAGDPTLVGQSSYGGKFGSGQPNYMASVAPQGIYMSEGVGSSVMTPFFNPYTGQYFEAPSSNYYAEEGSNWRRGTPTEAYNLPIVA